MQPTPDHLSCKTVKSIIDNKYFIFNYKLLKMYVESKDNYHETEVQTFFFQKIRFDFFNPGLQKY